MICDAAVILVFAEEVSVRVICGAAVVPQECLTRVASESVLQECQVRVSEKKCPARVSYKSVK